jgi:vancomycin permeability regulator SanA
VWGAFWLFGTAKTAAGAFGAIIRGFLVEKFLNLFLVMLVRYRAFLLYSVIGVSGATLDYLVFIFLHLGIGMDKILANAVSVSLGITNNFVLNAFFNFKRRDEIMRRFGLFYGVGLLGLVMSSFLLKIGVDWVGWNVSLVKFLSIFFVVLMQYNLNKYLAFGGGEKKVKLGWSYRAERLDAADCILVLGARVPNQTEPGVIVGDRLEAAIEAYHAGKAPMIVVSGRGDESSAKEIYVMENWLLARGVPRQAICVDGDAFRTIDSMKYLSRTRGKVRVIVCTQKFHLARSLFLARAFGLEAQGLIADRREYRDRLSFAVRETVARLRAVYDVWVAT